MSVDLRILIQDFALLILLTSIVYLFLQNVDISCFVSGAIRSLKACLC